jgi:Peptidase family S41
MEKLIIIFLLSFSLFLNTNAQDCTCKSDFEKLVNSIEKNYAGFEDKTGKKNIKSYEILKNQLRKQSFSNSSFGCYKLMKQYLSFFDDPHLNVSLKYDSINYPLLRSIFSAVGRKKIDEEIFKKQLQKNKPDSLEGIWIIKGRNTTYKVGLLKKFDYYEAVIINGDSITWFTGQTKFFLQKKANGKFLLKYFERDHIEKSHIFFVNSYSINIENIGTWVKIFPEQKIPANTNLSTPAIEYKKVNKDFISLTISSSSLKSKIIIDSLIKVNRKEILSTKNLIIDLRNNGGGYSICYDSLFPFICTNPILFQQYAVLASEENISLFNTIEKTTGEDMSKFIKKLNQNKNNFVSYDIDTIHCKKSEMFPEKIIVLINQYTASAAELFVQQAKQSAKVKIYGTPSKGALDYLDIVQQRNLICPLFSYSCPTSKRTNLTETSLFNQPIFPDTNIQNSVSNWIDFIIKECTE